MRRGLVSEPLTIINGWNSDSDVAKLMLMLEELGIEYTWDNSGTLYPDLIDYGIDLVMLSGDETNNTLEGYMLGFYDNPDGGEPTEYYKTLTINGMKFILKSLRRDKLFTNNPSLEREIE